MSRVRHQVSFLPLEHRCGDFLDYKKLFPSRPGACEETAHFAAFYFEYQHYKSIGDHLSKNSEVLYACSREHLSRIIAALREEKEECPQFKYPDLIVDSAGRIQRQLLMEVVADFIPEEERRTFFGFRLYSDGTESVVDLWKREKHKFGFGTSL